MNSGLIGFPKRSLQSLYDPLCPPGVPSSLNDEFSVDGSGTGAPPSWSSVGDITPTWVTRLGHLQLSAAASGGAQSAIIVRGLPSGNFTVATRVAHASALNFNLSMLVLRHASSQRMLAFGLYRQSGDQAAIGLSYSRYTSNSVRSGFTDTGFSDQQVFLRYSLSDSTLSVAYSVNGVSWITLYSEPISTHFVSGNPDQVGLMTQSFSGNASSALYDFFRYFQTADADIGRTITREVEP